MPSSPTMTSVPAGTPSRTSPVAVRVADDDELGPERSRLGQELVHRALRRQRVHAEALGLSAYDVERLGTDGPRGAHQADRAHQWSAHPRCIALTTKYVAGMTKSSPSTRSRIPPWPGSSRPMSLRPRWRLIIDWLRSPSGATTATTTP